MPHAESSPLRALIIDDEPLARRRLVQMLGGYPDVQIVGEADGGREALRLIGSLRPDVLLLDIEMPGVDGLTVVRDLPEGAAPAIVFVTAFQDHAVTAFELRATDFVVKPVARARLAAALDQARQTLKARQAGERLAELQSRLAKLAGPALTGAEPSLWVKIGADKRRLVLADILWLEAERDFVKIHTTVQTHLVSSMLGEMEAALDAQAFLRIHRSAIVRKDKVSAVLRGRLSTLTLELENGQRLPVGRKYREEVLAVFAATSGARE